PARRGWSAGIGRLPLWARRLPRESAKSRPRPGGNKRCGCDVASENPRSPYHADVEPFAKRKGIKREHLIGTDVTGFKLYLSEVIGGVHVQELKCVTQKTVQVLAGASPACGKLNLAQGIRM